MTTPTNITFVANTTPAISAAWLNGQNDWTYGWFGVMGETFTAAAARTAFDAAASGANTDITSLGGITTPLTIAQGGTGTASIPVFSVYASGATSIIATDTVVVLAGEDYDSDNFFATNKFTPTIAGYYQLNGRVQFNTASYLVQSIIRKNGTGKYYGDQQINTASSVSALVYFNGSTDYVELVATSATTQNTTTGAGITTLQGYLVKAG